MSQIRKKSSQGRGDNSVRRVKFSENPEEKQEHDNTITITDEGDTSRERKRQEAFKARRRNRGSVLSTNIVSLITRFNWKVWSRSLWMNERRSAWIDCGRNQAWAPTRANWLERTSISKHPRSEVHWKFLHPITVKSNHRTANQHQIEWLSSKEVAIPVHM